MATNKNTEKTENTTPETKAPETTPEITPETKAPETTPEITPEITPEVEEVKDTRVKVYVDRRTGNDEPNLVVGINGKNYVLPRGQESLVPPEVAEELARAKRAQLALDKTIDKLTAQAN